MDQYIIDISVQIGFGQCCFSLTESLIENYKLAPELQLKARSKFAQLQIYNAFMVMTMEDLV